MAELNHPGIVRILDPRCEEQGHLYFVMELMGGGTFRKAIRERRLDQGQALSMILAVAKTLAVAHEHKYVHRDVKPANILLSAEGEPKLSDFDLVCGVDTTGGTHTAAALGTYAYSSPECLSKPQEAGPAADVFSLGMTLVFALRGEDPHHYTMDRAHRTLPCQDLLRQVIRKATKPNPRYRYANAGALVLDLEKALVSPAVVGTSRAEIKASRPVWAKDFERDRFGHYAELELAQWVIVRLRWIAPGEFLMGSPVQEDYRSEIEGPQHRVRLTKGFWLADAPCRQAEWAAVMHADPSHFKGDNLPVEQVSWTDCQAFCQRIHVSFPNVRARLPTEAEWEYACRGGSQSAFNDGSGCTKPRGRDSALLRLGWYSENSGKETNPVRRLEPNPWGLYDMHGNIREWCLDTGRIYTADDQINPLANATAGDRVHRGGAWSDRAGDCRSASRKWGNPDWRGRLIGFRLAVDQ